MKFGSLFTGIAGFDKGLEIAGMECAWQCEIDQHANKVLERHYPGVRRYVDVKEITARNTEPVELICGGFPCQDLSVAGKRAGLAGERSGLWYEFRRIIEELAPEWVVIENVPGLLSSNGGKDFAIVLRGLVELRYGVCWRVLDSQYFGVAQRRRRVFIVGHLGTGRAAEVLFEYESLSGNPSESRKAGKDYTRNVTSGFGHSGGETVKLNPVANTINAQSGSETTAMIQGVVIEPNTPDGCLRIHDNVSPTINTMTGGQRQPCVIQQNTRDEVRIVGDGQIAGALSAQPGMKQQNYVMRTDNTGANGLGIKESKISETIDSGNGQAILAPALSTKNEVANSSATRDEWYKTSAQIIGAVRRLTPTECERLQSFPDGYTDGQSDTQRYKQLGNAVTVNVIEWIGRRIMELPHSKTTQHG